MDAVAVKAGREEHKTVAKVKEILHDEALQIRAEDVEVCRKIGEFGLELVKPGDGILTHCNAGQLATVKYGTQPHRFIWDRREVTTSMYCG